MSRYLVSSGRGGGGGIRVVSRLPTPKKGMLAYVKADYQGPGPWLDADFNLTLTPARIEPGGFVAVGFSDAGQVAYGNNYREGGAVAPLPPGLNLLVIQGGGAGADGVLYIRLSGDLLEAVNGRNLLLSFGDNEHELHRAEGSDDVWVSILGDLVPEADIWDAGTPVTIRLFVTGTRYGFTAGGLARIGQYGNPATQAEVAEGFWHVDPLLGEWRRGFGNDEAGGLPAAMVLQDGITAMQRNQEQWVGIMVGLAREDAGPDWAIATRAGQEEVAETFARYQLVSGGTTLTVEMSAAAGSGAAGNAWTIDFRAGQATSAGWQPGTTVIVVFVAPGATFENIRSVINQRSALSGGLRFTASLAGPGATAFPAGTRGVQNFAGGLDAVPADELGVELDVGNKTVTLVHLVGHTQAEIVAFLNDHEVDNDTRLFATLIAGSTPTDGIIAAPQKWPLILSYPRGALPRPTTQQIDDRIGDLTPRADGEDLVFELDGGVVVRVPSAVIKTLLTNHKVAHA